MKGAILRREQYQGTDKQCCENIAKMLKVKVKVFVNLKYDVFTKDIDT